MKDCVGNPLNIDDWVVYSDRHYADLIIGKITSFTPKKCYVEGSRSIDQFRNKKQTIKESWQVIRLGYNPEGNILDGK